MSQRSLRTLGVPLLAGTTAAATQTQGVTATTINVGVPYVDLAALASLGLHIDQGSYPDAYNALISNINAHGGINGRKIKLFLDAVNPTGTAATATACTQLIQDDKVFAVMGPLQPECYQAAGIPVVNGTAATSGVPAGAAPNFALDSADNRVRSASTRRAHQGGSVQGQESGALRRDLWRRGRDGDCAVGAQEGPR